LLCLENTTGTSSHHNSDSVRGQMALHDPCFPERLLGGPQSQLITPAQATTFMGGKPGEKINIPHLSSYTTAVTGNVKKVNLAKPTLSLA
jgi:hypothetical protein